MKRKHAAPNIFTIWMLILCLLPALTGCGDDEPVEKIEKPVKATAPPPVVVEWYPRPKQQPSQQTYIMVPAQQQPMMTQQPAYPGAPSQQQMTQTPTYSQPQYNLQPMPQTYGSWDQAGQQQQVIVQEPQYAPVYQYAPRPWESITPAEIHKKPKKSGSQQPAIVSPYGTWPAEGTAHPSWAVPGGYPGWGAGTYGVLPGTVMPGTVW